MGVGRGSPGRGRWRTARRHEQDGEPLRTVHAAHALRGRCGEGLPYLCPGGGPAPRNRMDRSAKRRGSSPGEVSVMPPTDCYLARFSDRPCAGRLIKAHLIPRQLLRRELGASFEAHGDTWVWACGGIMGNSGHHGMLDQSRTLRIPRIALPFYVEDFAAKHGLGWWLDREYGPREAAA